MNKKTKIEDNAIRYDIESYLEENITLMENQIQKNEELYNDVNEIFQDCKNNSNFSGIKDNIEMANSLSKIRATGIEGADKLLKAKLAVLDTENKFRKVKSENENQAEKDAILQSLHSILSTNPDMVKMNKDFSGINKSSNEEYERFLEEKVQNGELQLSQNDQKALNKFKESNIPEKDEEDK